MKREDIKAIFAEATDEQLKKIMDLNGSDVEREKGKLTALEAELNEKKQAFETLNSEIETLKSNNASAEDYKAKFEQLQNDIAEKEKAEKEAAEKAEREANIKARYEAAAVGKDGKPLQWRHEAIKNDYLRKFTEALDDKANEGKSDADIFNTLTKEDGAAFNTPSAQNVFGGAGTFGGNDLDEAKINAIMGIS